MPSPLPLGAAFEHEQPQTAQTKDNLIFHSKS